MRYAISDIHGCNATFKHALNEINFSKDDELYLLGDYVDRGPDSMGVLETIWELEDSGHQVTCLRGNHEQMVLDFYAGNRNLYEWMPPPAREVRTLAWMRDLRHYLLLPDYLLVHAGLNFFYLNPLDDTHAMLWERYWYNNIDRHWLGSRTIVHGHTPAKMLEIKKGIRDMSNNQYACIDSGCSQAVEGMGYLTVLNLDTKEGRYFRNVEK